MGDEFLGEVVHGQTRGRFHVLLLCGRCIQTDQGYSYGDRDWRSSGGSGRDRDWRFRERRRSVRRIKRECTPAPVPAIAEKDIDINVVYSTMLCTEQCCVQYNVVYSTMLCTVQCCVQCNVVYSTKLCTVQCCVQNNVVYSTALCTVQCCVQYNVVYSTMLCTVQHYVQYNVMYSTMLCTVQCCVQYNVVICCKVMHYDVIDSDLYRYKQL